MFNHDFKVPCYQCKFKNEKTIRFGEEKHVHGQDIDVLGGARVTGATSWWKGALLVGGKGELSFVFLQIMSTLPFPNKCHSYFLRSLTVLTLTKYL